MGKYSYVKMLVPRITPPHFSLTIEVPFPLMIVLTLHIDVVPFAIIVVNISPVKYKEKPN